MSGGGGGMVLKDKCGEGERKHVRIEEKGSVKVLKRM